ncbi:MAG: hypothetical protein P4L76_16340 [Beijerinckiaceae bacterium]|nr:hypothetical protein [Beijerinckiaceae bacterium]
MPIAKGNARTTTAIVLSTKQLELVRRAALVRAMMGTAVRVSVSDIVREALAAYMPKLEAEMIGFAASSQTPAVRA